MEQRYFKTQAEFRAWLFKHHATATELGVVLHRKSSGEPSMTWSEAVDQALCFGWIDSVARRLDDTRRVQRFTPRKPKSNWSAVNIKKVAELTAQGLMTPAGLAAFGKYAAPHMQEWLLHLISILVSVSVISLLFAMMFKWLPDAAIDWHDVWLGAIVTAALFATRRDWIAQSAMAP